MYLCMLAEKNGKKCFPIILRCIDTFSLYGLNSSSDIIKSMPNILTSFSYLTFDLIPTVEYNALKQNKKSKSISLYFVSIILEKFLKSLPMSETLIYPGESDVILIRSIFVDYIVANVICKNTRLVSFILITDTRQVCFLISNSCTLRIIQRIKRIGYARLMGTRHMKINARRLYIIVSQQFLYGSKVCPLFQ